MAGLINASAFNRLGQYARYPGNRTYYYAELTISFLAVTETISSTHCAYPRRDGQAEYYSRGNLVNARKHSGCWDFARTTHITALPRTPIWLETGLASVPQTLPLYCQFSGLSPSGLVVLSFAWPSSH